MAAGEHARATATRPPPPRTTAARLDAEYSEERLGKLAFNGGVE